MRNTTKDTAREINTQQDNRVTAMPKTKKMSALKRTYNNTGYTILTIVLITVVISLLVGYCVGAFITNNSYKVEDVEGRGVIYCVEAIVVAQDSTLCTLEDTERKLWLVDNPNLSRGDSLILYIADNNTKTNCKDDIIIQIWGSLN